MQRKAGDLAAEIERERMPVLCRARFLHEVAALFPQIRFRRVDIVRADGDVAVRAPAGAFPARSAFR